MSSYYICGLILCMRSHTARVKWLVVICEDTAGLMESRPKEEWLYWGCSFFLLKRFIVTCAVAFGFTSKPGRRDLLSLYPRSCGSNSTKSRDLLLFIGNCGFLSDPLSLTILIVWILIVKRPPLKTPKWDLTGGTHTHVKRV